MNLFKISRIKIAAGLASAVAVVAVVYRVSQTGKEKIHIALNSVFDRGNISVDTPDVENVKPEVVTTWEQEDDDEEDFLED